MRGAYYLYPEMQCSFLHSICLALRQSISTSFTAHSCTSASISNWTYAAIQLQPSISTSRKYTPVLWLHRLPLVEVWNNYLYICLILDTGRLLHANDYQWLSPATSQKKCPQWKPLLPPKTPNTLNCWSRSVTPAWNNVFAVHAIYCEFENL